MKRYETKDIRNIAVMGHLGAGKTSFIESTLYVSGAKEKKGTVEEKNPSTDFMQEEKHRQTSLSISLAPTEHEGCKFNFIDTPGSEEFPHEIEQALEVVKGAVLVIDATKGIEVGTERILHQLNQRNVPTVLFVNKMDKDNVKFDELVQKLKDTIGYQAVPFTLPIGTGESFEGYVDLVDVRARYLKDGSLEEGEVPDSLSDRAAELREQIVESVAETSEELLEKHFDGQELTQEEIYGGLRQGVVDGDLKPIVVGSTYNDIGIRTLLSMLGRFMPSPDQLKAIKGKHPETEAEETRETKADAPLSAYVFKTTVDPFVGSVSLIKVNSGTLEPGSELLVANTKKTAKINTLFTLRGQEQLQVDSVPAGDIGAVTKVDAMYTGCTITARKHPIIYEGPSIPSPTIYVAIRPKQKADEDKISSVLQRLNVEDPSFEVKRNKETAQLLIGGQGMTHIDFILEKMKNMFKVDVEKEDQKIVYRETIKKKVEAEGRHKKQSGGAGQFGVVHIRFEPLDPNETEFEFAEEIYGGAVPKNFFPAVEKGLVEGMEKGPTAGFPVIGVKATLFDGQHHPVDSNEISFKMAAQLALREAYKKAKPTILEPIMRVEVFVKDDYVGDVMGDINKRRGRVLSMDPLEGGRQKVTAEIPEAEIVTYAIDLKAMTQGSGVFTREFDRYEEVPGNLIDKIVESYRKEDS